MRARYVRLLLVTCSLLVGTELSANEATPVSSITAHDGFEVELLRSAQPGEDSWISMTFDDRGRLILGLDNQGVGRLTLPTDGSRADFERIENSFRHCRGVLYAHDSLYVCATNSKGFYRLRDTNADDQFDEVKLLKTMDYRSRYGHGTNQVVLGPDDMIYVVNGNDVSFPEGVSPDSPYRDPRNDWLVPNPHDAGHDNRVGHILRTDPEGRTWEVIAGGFRNQVDIAFNSDGEMFTYDADMEWDAGLPWYRPTRLNHVVSGGEYGWRWGTGKWPPYYTDSLPTTLDTGLGSPTGIEFGTKSNFPRKYRQALFMADWQNGRIYAVHMKPQGASYQCEYELFIEGGPLNVCDLEFGPQGDLYFITGGRGSQSGLYRVRYTGPQGSEQIKPDTEREQQAKSARELRRSIEVYHTTRDAKAVDALWPHLGSNDVWIRYAARIALERQDIPTWRDQALLETDVDRSLMALLALARVGIADEQPALMEALLRHDLDDVGKDQLLTALRIYAVSFTRQGRAAPTVEQSVLRELERLYPHRNSTVSQELCELLVFLKSSLVISKTVPMLETASTQEAQIHYAQLLVRVEGKWPIDARRAFVRWLARAQRFPGGKLVDATIKNLRQDFVTQLTEAERDALGDELAELDSGTAADLPTTSRPLVRHWMIEELLPRADAAATGRDYEAGRRALAAGACLRCHRIGDEGGRIGPDLTAVGKRYDNKALLESILLPSKVVDPKYRYTAYVLINGKVVQGRPIGVSSKEITIETDPLSGASIKIQRDAIEESSPAQVSPMPGGLADVLTADEILDLLAYLRAGGDPTHAAFE